jgi:hypothetical protein
VVQLVSLTLYSRNGQQRTIPFKLGRLNVITGQSKTGKTVMVKLVDYCLGRGDVPTSAGGVEKALGWVGALWQFEDGGRAFVGRPIPEGNAAENNEAMLRFGDGNLTPAPFNRLEPNMNTRTMRDDLGSRIGITESRIVPPAGSMRTPLRAHLGHAAFLCLQNQDEISNSSRIFHRSGQAGVDDALRDTIPYFLGAAPPDQAVLRSMLRQENRRLQRLEREVREAERVAKDIDADLRLLLAEAVDAGLPVEPDPSGTLPRADLIIRLQRAARDQTTTRPPPSIAQQDSRRAAQAELAVAEDELDQLMQHRALLLDETQGSTAYADAVAVQLGRLTSLNLLPVTPDRPTTDSDEQCPVCGSDNSAHDATATQMRETLVELSGRLQNVRTATPAKSAALDDINSQIEQAEARVQRARTALEVTFGADASVGRQASRRQDYTRGRIDAILSRAPAGEDAYLDSLRERATLAQQAVEELQTQLSDDTLREQLNSKLLAVGRDLTDYARRLGLEHSERDVRIDLARLTVIADVDDNPVPLDRIGSAENWIGYHIASHLALHRSFLRHERPVPRLLVIDQPSQGHYPSDVAKRTGRAETDADELAVRRLFELMDDFTKTNGDAFQIIVVDHANLDVDWFQEAIVEDWRGPGNALVPAEWL